MIYFARHEHQQGFTLEVELLEEDIQSQVRFLLSLQALNSVRLPTFGVSVYKLILTAI